MSRSVPAVDRAFTILELIRSRGPMNLASLVEATGLNKSTVYYLLQTLVARRVLEPDETGYRYSLGIGLVELGAAAAERLTEITVAKRHLAELLEPMNATFTLYQRVAPTRVTLVDKLERLSRVRVTVPLGSQIPIQGGSFGRAFLAYDDEATVEVVLEHGLQAFTPKSLVDRDAFLAELAEVRRRGWAVDHEGFALGVSAVAAPIFGPDGRVRLVAAAITFTSILTDDLAQQYGERLRHTCDAIGATLADVASTPSLTPRMEVAS